jgi:hypothetical protein
MVAHVAIASSGINFTAHQVVVKFLLLWVKRVGRF